MASTPVTTRTPRLQRPRTRDPHKPKVKSNKSSRSALDRAETIHILANSIRGLETKVELEEIKLKESKGPTELSLAKSCEYLSTPRSMPLQSAIRSLFSNKVYPFRISTALNMSSSAGGIINSLIGTSVVQSAADYTSLSAIFEEFFITRIYVKWEPISQYQFPLTGLPDGKTVANVPVGCANLLNLAPAYTSMTNMSNNFKYQHSSSGTPFSYEWINDQSPNGGVLSTTATTQTWCSTTSGQTYTGAMQFISQSAPPGLPVSTVLGVFAVHFEVLMRTRQ
jgi:hypothetical protein